MNRLKTRVEKLDRDACLQLLEIETGSLGRLAMVRPGKPPYVAPVNYTLLRGSIVFRTPPGTKLTLLVSGPVSFEVDRWDPTERTGWSVVVEGLAYEASDREMEIEEIDLDSPAEQQNSRWVRLMPGTITGRRITREPPAPDPAAVEVEFVPDWGMATHEAVVPDGFAADWRLGAWHGGENRFPG